MVEYLLKYENNLNLNKIDYNGFTSIENALDKIVYMILNYGINNNIKNKY